MPMHRPLKPFDVVEFDGSTNVASVRKVVTEDGELVAYLKYMLDDGSLQFTSFTMTVRAVMRLCTLRDEGAYQKSRRPAAVGRSSSRKPPASHEGPSSSRPDFKRVAKAWKKLKPVTTK